MNRNVLDDICRSHGFSLELQSIPSASGEAFFAILVPVSGMPDLAAKKPEIDLLERKLRQLYPAIQYVTIQCGSD